MPQVTSQVVSAPAGAAAGVSTLIDFMPGPEQRALLVQSEGAPARLVLSLHGDRGTTFSRVVDVPESFPLGDCSRPVVIPFGPRFQVKVASVVNTGPVAGTAATVSISTVGAEWLNSYETPSQQDSGVLTQGGAGAPGAWHLFEAAPADLPRTEVWVTNNAGVGVPPTIVPDAQVQRPDGSLYDFPAGFFAVGLTPIRLAPGERLQVRHPGASAVTCIVRLVHTQE